MLRSVAAVGGEPPVAVVPEAAGDRRLRSAGMDALDVERERIDGRPHAWRVRLRGSLDVATAAHLDEMLATLTDLGARFVVLDLGAVDFLDSTGLRSIVDASHRLRDVGGQLTCSGLSGAAGRVLEVTGLLEALRDPPETTAAGS